MDSETSSIFSDFADSKSFNTDIYEITDKEELTENWSKNMYKKMPKLAILKIQDYN